MSKKFGLLLAVLVAAMLALAGCAKDDSGADGSAGDGPQFNSADVQFAQDMIVHHSQALDMVELTDGRDLDPDFQTVVDGIKAAQAPEIETMAGWLEAWGEDVPDTGMDGMDMGDDEMPGMMTEDDMAALNSAEGDSFRMMFLQMMIDHHQGAVQMAESEQTAGENPDAIELAGSIVSTQEAEIATMEGLLGS